MLLSDIRLYLTDTGRASLGDIATRFDIDKGAVRGMLDVLVQKGKVREIRAPEAACGSRRTGSCGSSGSACCCGSTPDPVYEWAGRQGAGRSSL